MDGGGGQLLPLAELQHQLHRPQRSRNIMLEREINGGVKGTDLQRGGTGAAAPPPTTKKKRVTLGHFGFHAPPVSAPEQPSAGGADTPPRGCAALPAPALPAPFLGLWRPLWTAARTARGSRRAALRPAGPPGAASLLHRRSAPAEGSPREQLAANPHPRSQRLFLNSRESRKCRGGRNGAEGNGV